MFNDWQKYPENKPKKYGKYEVYRAGCAKQHYEVWNGTGWAYNNKDITHFRQIVPPTDENNRGVLPGGLEINIISNNLLPDGFVFVSKNLFKHLKRQ